MLLRNYFPREFYESFDLADYALCFKCHSENTVLEGADFSHARNYKIDVTKNRIKGAKFKLPDAIALLRSLDIVLVD